MLIGHIIVAFIEEAFSGIEVRLISREKQNVNLIGVTEIILRWQSNNLRKAERTDKSMRSGDKTMQKKEKCVQIFI